ncbi:mucin-1-like isoform X2 [Rhineura floridana]|uniref:mucin-1-like isoform X2 n=1 Tax=Rhineura floridana TaxID=261503 RepID=UPI002AC81448|nr:mucin-1-like isoform X2 [Rhineura floridana]
MGDEKPPPGFERGRRERLAQLLAGGWLRKSPTERSRRPDREAGPRSVGRVRGLSQQRRRAPDVCAGEQRLHPVRPSGTVVPPSRSPQAPPPQTTPRAPQKGATACPRAVAEATVVQQQGLPVPKGRVEAPAAVRLTLRGQSEAAHSARAHRTLFLGHVRRPSPDSWCRRLPRPPLSRNRPGQRLCHCERPAERLRCAGLGRRRRGGDFSSSSCCARRALARSGRARRRRQARGASLPGAGVLRGERSMDRRCRRLLALLALLAAPGRSRDSQRPLDDASAAAEGPLLPGPTCSGLLEALPSQQLRVEGQEEAPHAPPASRDPPQVGLEGGGRLGQAAAAAAGRFVEEPDAGETRVSDTPQPGLAVGNSGLDFSRLGDLLPQGQSTAKTLKTLLLGSAEPPGITWHRPLPSSRASAFPTGLQPTLPTSSAVLEASRDEMVSWLTDVEESSEESSPGTTARRMQFPAGEAGRTGSAEPPNAAGASGLPQLSQPLITSKFVTFLPTPVWLPVSASPVDAAGQTSCPSSCSEEFSSWSTGERALEPTRALLLLGSNRLAVTQTEAGPESERSLGATAAGNEASSPVPAEGLEMPAGSSRQRSPETRSSPGAELQGTLLLASTQRPGKATPEAESVWLPTPSAASGQEWDVATITAQLLPRDWSTATFATGSEALLEQPGGSTAEPQTRPHESWTAVGHFFAKAAPEQSPTLPGSRAGLDHTAKTTEEVIIPGNFVPSKRAPSHRTTEATRAEQPPEDAQLSAGTPSPAAGQMEEAPSLFSHLGAALLLSPVGPTTHPVSRQDAPSTSSLSPGPTFLTLPFGLGWLPDGATAGPHASGATATFHSSTSPLMVSETALTGASTATGEEPRSQSPTEPYSTWYIKGGDPAESSSWPRQLPPKWQAEGGTSSSAASSPPGASVRHGESGGAPTGSGKGPHRPTTLPTKQAAREGSPREASVGAATEVAELSRRIPGRGDCADWLPSSTVPPVSSMAASFPTEGDVGSSAPTVDPELPSQMAPSSALASEAAGPMMGTTVMPGSASVTHQPWTFPGRPWQWEWGPRPRAPAEGSVRGATHSPYGPRGPLRTTAAPAESLPGSSEHTWTTSPASEPESVTRGGLLITGSRLSSATPDKALTQLVPAVPRGARPRAPQVFVVENQPPLLKATFLHIPCELVLAMEFSRSFRNPDTPEYQGLVLSINETVTPLFESLPGFQRLEVKTIRPGSVVVAFDALFLAEAPGLWAALNRSSLSDRLPSGLWVANASLLQSTTQGAPWAAISGSWECAVTTK